ncbi:MAG: NAD(P)-binding protein, partial [Alphaproteobacteria bacterium]|nr:NAD(P)-binding protein [Alphaproteobacteria bacterium]
MPNRYVHIVGAGLSGLSCALQLSLLGESVVLYDAAP